MTRLCSWPIAGAFTAGIYRNNQNLMSLLITYEESNVGELSRKMMYFIMCQLITYGKSKVGALSCKMMYFIMNWLITYEKSIVGELSC